MEENKIKEIHYNNIIKTILQSDRVSPPLTLESDIVSDFKERCEYYIDSLKKYDKENNTKINFDLMIKRISIIVNGITKCLEEFLSGDIKSAYDVFNDIFSSSTINKHIRRITIPLYDVCNEKRPLFRVRKSDAPLTDRTDIFHIPFTKRYNV
ncbi:hypothetical protein IIG59_004258, partial [Salmonella enterica]|nr:hypothetical protein [Salmonella enterica]EDX5543924.1 hypothetical protein [Salmonella enterica subsp. enterica serovar Braenderup]EGM9922669.1 hypothetical protein [Salmonella enterica]